MPSLVDLTVVTPTIPGRERLLGECTASVGVLGLPHLIERDEARDGPAAIRNRLLEQVATEWVVFLDDDDLLLPNYVDAVTPHLAAADVVYTGWHLTGGGDGPFPIPFDPDRLADGDNFIPVTACARTAMVRAVGGFPTDVREEDHALWRAMLAVGARFAYAPVIAWRYRRQAGSRSEANR